MIKNFLHRKCVKAVITETFVVCVHVCVCVYKLWKPPTVKAVSRRGRRETHTRAGEKHRVGERASGVTGE